MAGTSLKSDSQIQKAVIDELQWDTRVDGSRLNVEVDDGVVTLTGDANSYATKVAADEAAHRVLGVLDVANDITVHGAGIFYRTDTEIAQSVRRALEADVFVPARRVQSSVSSGWVTLSGTVDSWSQREDAEAVILRQPGVVGVVNAIYIDAREVDSETVRESIEEALERRAEREADRIQVTVHDGAVTLAGRVHSWAERRAAIGAAGHAPGVRSIEDLLQVSPN